METSLVRRWLEATKPFSMGDLQAKFSESYCKALGLDEGARAAFRKAVAGFSEEKARDVLVAFAEEHFSEDALVGAVSFFESEPGKKYREQRKRVVAASMDRINRLMAESVKKAFGT